MYSSTGRKNGTFGCNPGKGGSYPFKLELWISTDLNEKLNWLKLYDRNEKYPEMVDKIEGKRYISNIFGPDNIIPVYKEWERVEDINLDSLPSKFVLKTNHDSGGYVICTDKTKFDLTSAKKTLKKSFNRNYYYVAREWPYKNIHRKVFAEKYLDMGDCITDYKVMCFNGIPQIIQINRAGKDLHTQDFYDAEWKRLPISQKFYAPPSEEKIGKPVQLDEMLKKSAILSKDMYFLRVDWFIADGKLYNGELTLYDGAGIMPFDDCKMDLYIGSLLRLPTDVKIDLVDRKSISYTNC